MQKTNYNKDGIIADTCEYQHGALFNFILKDSILIIKCIYYIGKLHIQVIENVVRDTRLLDKIFPMVVDTNMSD